MNSMSQKEKLQYIFDVFTCLDGGIDYVYFKHGLEKYKGSKKIENSIADFSILVHTLVTVGKVSYDESIRKGREDE